MTIGETPLDTRAFLWKQRPCNLLYEILLFAHDCALETSLSILHNISRWKTHNFFRVIPITFETSANLTTRDDVAKQGARVRDSMAHPRALRLGIALSRSCDIDSSHGRKCYRQEVEARADVTPSRKAHVARDRPVHRALPLRIHCIQPCTFARHASIDVAFALFRPTSCPVSAMARGETNRRP